MRLKQIAQLALVDFLTQQLSKEDLMKLTELIKLC